MRSLSGEHLRAGAACALALCVAAIGCRGPDQGAPPEEPDPAAEPTGAPTDDQEEETSTLDSLQESVTQRVQSTARWLDSFLADERFLAEQNRTTVTVRVDTLVEEREGVDLNLKLQARVVLPGTERRFHFVASGYDDGDGGVDEDRQPEGAPGEDQRDLGLQYFLKATDRNNFRGEAGLRFNDFTPNPFVGMRYRHTVPLGTWEARAFERLRWYVEEEWESQTTIDFERLIGERFFFRSSTSGSWYAQEPGFYYGQYFTFYHWVEERGLYTYEWNNNFSTRPNNVLDETQLRFRYAQRIFRDWILFEVAPQVTFRRDIDYQPAWGILFRLEVLFGGQTIDYHSPLHRTADDREFDDRLDR